MKEKRKPRKKGREHAFDQEKKNKKKVRNHAIDQNSGY